MGSVHLIRHGQASFGAADYDELSAIGHEQGRMLGRWYQARQLQPARVVSGGMKRHRQTAAACLTEMGRSDPELHEDPGFREYDHEELLIRQEPAFASKQGAAEWLQDQSNPRGAFQQLFTAAFARWMSGAHDADYQESWPVFRDRCVAALRRQCEQAGRSATVLIFTSGGPITAITHSLLGSDPAGIGTLNSSIINGSVTRLLYSGPRISLSSLNNTAHLEAADDERLITYR